MLPIVRPASIGARAAPRRAGFPGAVQVRPGSVYYDSPPPGGIDFNQTQPPRYTDFAYISLSFGTAYCVSDTAITSSDVRAETLRHTLLSFVFANGILATTINLVVSLASG